jgi:hypothetical protein
MRKLDVARDRLGNAQVPMVRAPVQHSEAVDGRLARCMLRRHYLYDPITNDFL